ncbi:hypothetical protein EI94DRAFT_1699123 [Lactarius quietus]|nr:hypothetical protein EI94DRAFT_1699123 [Lactarius quietus]
MVSTPPPIHPGGVFMLTPEYHRGPLTDPAPVHPMAESSGTQLPTQHVPDKKAVSLLWELEASVKQIPSDTPSATPEHQLNIFAVDPRTCVAEPGEDDWLILNQMMSYPSTKYPSSPSTSLSQASMEMSVGPSVGNRKGRDIIDEVIDVDEIEEIPRQVEHRGEHGAVPRKWQCEGFLVTFPEGLNHHISYPFGIHGERSVPWNYWSIDDMFYLQAKSCQKTTYTKGRACENCWKLTSSTLFASIMDRIQHGANQSVPLMYHGVGALITIACRKTDQIDQLCMSKLNDSQKLLAKVGALDEHKQWVLAIASG